MRDLFVSNRQRNALFTTPPALQSKSSFGWFNMFANRSKQSSENETKFVQERISLAERNVTELSLGFAAYARKAARLRDVGDELTTTLQQYATAETVNQSLSNGLNGFASALNTINGYGDKRVQYIDQKVVGQLTPYETTCKSMRDGVKNIFITKDKETLRQRQLDRVKERNPRNRQQIVEAESELVQAKSEVAKTIHNLEEKLLTFERQKLHDLREILLDFVATEIGYHSKAISLLTEAYGNIAAINIENDVEDLQRVFDELDPKFKASLGRKHEGKLSRYSQSLGAIDTTGKKGIPDDKRRRKTFGSEEVLDQDNEESDGSESETSRSESVESESDHHTARKASTKKQSTRKYVH